MVVLMVVPIFQKICYHPVCKAFLLNIFLTSVNLKLKAIVSLSLAKWSNFYPKLFRYFWHTLYKTYPAFSPNHLFIYSKFLPRFVTWKLSQKISQSLSSRPPSFQSLYLREVLSGTHVLSVKCKNHRIS